MAVVIPTVQGRENDLQRCLDAYSRTVPDTNIYVERDHETCGEAWIAGAERAQHHGFDYLHLTADDLEPHDGWLEVALETVDKGHIPAPLVFLPDGSLQSAGLVGFGCYTGHYEDWMPIEATTIPFLTCEMWNRIGMIPIHYCTDLWVSAKGRDEGFETVIRTGMVFTHHNAQPGRRNSAMGDTHQYLQYRGQA